MSMREYRVVWEIDVDAESPQDAAQAAHMILRDPTRVGDFFDVYEVDEDGVVGDKVMGVEIE